MIRKEQLEPMSIAPVAARTFVATPGIPDTAVTAADYVVAVDALASSAVVDLPDATTVAGREFKILKIDAGGNILTIQSSVPTQTINGSPTRQMVGIGAVSVSSDGSNYYVG